MAVDDAPRHTLPLPNELLEKIFIELFDAVTWEAQDELHYGYYTFDYRNAQVEGRAALAELGRTSRQFRAVVSQLLFRRCFLVNKLPDKDSDEQEEVLPDNGVVTLALFLRTLLEDPVARSWILHLDCWFFLGLVEGRYMGTIQGSYHVYSQRTMSRRTERREWDFAKECMESGITSSSKTQDQDRDRTRHMLNHVGLLGQEQRPADLAQRLFAAILLLLPNLQGLSMAPLPKRRWCVRDALSDSDPDPEPIPQPRPELGEPAVDPGDDDTRLVPYEKSGFYSTLSRLLEEAYSDPILADTALPSLQRVALAFIPGFRSVNSRYYKFSEHPNLPPGYSYRLDACMGLLKAPRIVELDSSADSGLRAARASFAESKDLRRRLRRVYLATDDHPAVAAQVVSGLWRPTTLAIAPSCRAQYEARNGDAIPSDEEDFDEPDDLDDGFLETNSSQQPQQQQSPTTTRRSKHRLIHEHWDTALLRLADTTRVLDIGDAGWDNRILLLSDAQRHPLDHLTCLHRLTVLEHLRIGLPLLNTNEGFLSRPLASILPPNLKTLVINDRYAADHYVRWYPGEEAWDQDFDDASINSNDPFSEEPSEPRLYRQRLSAALLEFARTCGETHPRLRSVVVYGRVPRLTKDNTQWRRRMLEGEDPWPDMVLVGSEEIASVFAGKGVVLREFWHGQERQRPFRDMVGDDG